MIDWMSIWTTLEDTTFLEADERPLDASGGPLSKSMPIRVLNRANKEIPLIRLEKLAAWQISVWWIRSVYERRAEPMGYDGCGVMQDS